MSATFSEGRQVLDRQLDALGAATERPNLGACLDYLREGDVLAVLDLGRRAGELDQRGIGFRALNTLMDTTTPAGRAFLRIRRFLNGQLDPARTRELADRMRAVGLAL